MVVFVVACRQAMSGEVHDMWVRGHRETMRVRTLKEHLVLQIGAPTRQFYRCRDIRILQGGSVAPDDKPLIEFVDWFHLDTVPTWGHFDITVDFVVIQQLCTYCERPVLASPNKCCELAHYCNSWCQLEDWKRHKHECVCHLRIARAFRAR